MQRFKYSLVNLLALVVITLSAACSSTSPETSTRLTAPEKETLTKRAKAPQTFGLTAYATENGARFGGAFRPQQNGIGRLPLAAEKNSTAPVIAINDDKAFMLIDPTAAESWLTVEASVALKTTALASPDLFEKNAKHVYDNIGGFAAVLPRFNLEKLTVNEGVFYVRNAHGPLDGLTRWEKEPPLDGVFGTDFLRAFEFVRISLRGRQVVISGSGVYPYADNAIAALPLTDLDGAIAVECMMDGEKQTALLDLAGDFEVALEKPTGSSMRQLTLGDIVFRNIEVVSSFDLGLGLTSPPRIGRQLLERYDLVIHQRGQQLLFERPVE